MAAPGQHEPKARPRLPQRGERLEQTNVVLVRPRARRVEQEGLPLDLVVGLEDLVVDRVRDDVDAPGIELEVLDGAPADELARDEDGGRPASGTVVGHASERPARRAEELRQVAVLDVVQRHDRRSVRAGHGDGQRVVDDVERRERSRHASRAPRGERHRRDPRRPALADRGIVHLDRRQPVRHVLGPGGHENRVLGGADTGQRPHELAGVGLGTTEIAGGESEQ